jgi:Zn-dependent protease with chaperone function
MSNTASVLFYDGHRTQPRAANIELVNGNIHVFDEEGNAGQSLLYPLGNCRASVLGERMFVYLEGGAGACIEISISNPLYLELSVALKAGRKGWFEKLLKQKWPVLLGILIVLVGSIYFIMSTVIPIAVIKLISPQQEAVMGEKLYNSFVAGTDIDTASSRIVQQFADQLKLSEKYKIKVTVLKDEEVNAFALPGGYIIVHTSIIKILDHPEELVALLGHEATHINKRHSLKGMLSGISMAILQSMILNGFGNGDFILRHANSLQQLSYSRRLEREADNDGMQLMLDNRVDPSGMTRLLEGLQKTHKGGFPYISFLSTHPLTYERIKNTNSFIHQHKSMTFATNDSLNSLWVQLKSK